MAEVREVPGGSVLRHPPLPDVWQLNRVHLDDPAPAAMNADALVALADRALRGVDHRRVTVDDLAAAERLWPALEASGWRRERTVVMALDPARAPSSSPRDPRVAELDATEVSALQRRLLVDDAGIDAAGPAAATRAADAAGAAPGGADSLPARLALAQSLLRSGTRWRAFGAAPVPGGPPAASAMVFLDPGAAGARVALVDQVATLRRFREQGLATAVVGAAIAAARGWRADVIGLFADAEDWPQVMYAGIGFAAVGRQVTLHRDSGPAPTAP